MIACHFTVQIILRFCFSILIYYKRVESLNYSFKYSQKFLIFCNYFKLQTDILKSILSLKLCKIPQEQYIIIEMCRNISEYLVLIIMPHLPKPPPLPPRSSIHIIGLPYAFLWKYSCRIIKHKHISPGFNHNPQSKVKTFENGNLSQISNPTSKK